MADQEQAPSSDAIPIGEVFGEIDIRINQELLARETKRFNESLKSNLSLINNTVEKEFREMVLAVGMGEKSLTSFRHFLDEMEKATETKAGVNTPGVGSRARLAVENILKDLQQTTGFKSAGVVQTIANAAFEQLKVTSNTFYTNVRKQITKDITGAATAGGLSVEGALRSASDSLGINYSRFRKMLGDQSAGITKDLDEQGKAQVEAMDHNLALFGAAITRQQQLFTHGSSLIGTKTRLTESISDMRSYVRDLAETTNFASEQGKKLLGYHVALRSQINAAQFFEQRKNSKGEPVGDLKPLSLPHFDVNNVEGSIKSVHDALFRLVEMAERVDRELGDVNHELGGLGQLDATSSLNKGLLETQNLLSTITKQDSAVDKLKAMVTQLRNLSALAASGTKPKTAVQALLNEVLEKNSLDFQQANLSGRGVKGGRRNLQLPRHVDVDNIDTLITSIEGEEGLIDEAVREQARLSTALTKHGAKLRELAVAFGIDSVDLVPWLNSQAALLGTVTTMTKVTDDVSEKVGSGLSRVQQLILQANGSAAVLKARLDDARAKLAPKTQSFESSKRLLEGYKDDLARAIKTGDLDAQSRLRGILHGVNDPNATKRDQQGLIKSTEIAEFTMFAVQGRIRRLQDALDLVMAHSLNDLGVSDVVNNRLPLGAEARQALLKRERDLKQLNDDANLSRRAISSTSSQGDVFNEEGVEEAEDLANSRRQVARIARRIATDQRLQDELAANAKRGRRGTLNLPTKTPLQEVEGLLSQDIQTLRSINKKLDEEAAVLKNGEKGMAEERVFLESMERMVAEQVEVAARIKARAALLAEQGVTTDLPADVNATIARLTTVGRPQDIPKGAGDPRAVLRNTLARITKSANERADLNVRQLIRNFNEAFRGLSPDTRIADPDDPTGRATVTLNQALTEVGKEIANNLRPGSENARKRGDKGLFSERAQELYNTINTATADEALGLRGIGDILVERKRVKDRIAGLLAESEDESASKLAIILDESGSKGDRAAATLVRQAEAKVGRARKLFNTLNRVGADDVDAEAVHQAQENLSGVLGKMQIEINDALKGINLDDPENDGAYERISSAINDKYKAEYKVLLELERRAALGGEYDKLAADIVRAEKKRDAIVGDLANELRQEQGGTLLTALDRSALATAQADEQTLRRQFAQAQARFRTFGTKGDIKAFVDQVLGTDKNFVGILSSGQQAIEAREVLFRELVDLINKEQADSPLDDIDKFTKKVENVPNVNKVGRTRRNALDVVRMLRQRRGDQDPLFVELKDALLAFNQAEADPSIDDFQLADFRGRLNRAKIAGRRALRSAPNKKRSTLTSSLAEIRKVNVSLREFYEDAEDGFVRALAEDAQLVAQLMSESGELSAKFISDAEDLARLAFNPDTGDVEDQASIDRLMNIRRVQKAKQLFGIGDKKRGESKFARDMRAELIKLGEPGENGEPARLSQDIVGDVSRSASEILLAQETDVSDIVQDALMEWLREQVAIARKGGFIQKNILQVKRGIFRLRGGSSLEDNFRAQNATQGLFGATDIPIEQVFPPPSSLKNRELVLGQAARSKERTKQISELRDYIDRNDRLIEAFQAYMDATGRTIEEGLAGLQLIDRLLGKRVLRDVGGLLLGQTATVDVAKKFSNRTDIAKQTGTILNMLSGLQKIVPLPEGSIPGLREVQPEKEMADFREADAKAIAVLKNFAFANGEKYSKFMADLIANSKATEKAVTQTTRRVAVVGSAAIGKNPVVLGRLLGEAFDRTAQSILSATKKQAAFINEILVDVTQKGDIGEALVPLFEGKGAVIKQVAGIFQGVNSAGKRQEAGGEKAAILAQEATEAVALWNVVGDEFDENVGRDIGAMILAGKKVHAFIVSNGNIIREASAADLKFAERLELSKRAAFGLTPRASVTTGGQTTPVGPPIVFPQKLGYLLNMRPDFFKKELEESMKNLKAGAVDDSQLGRAMQNVGENVAKSFGGSLHIGFENIDDQAEKDMRAILGGIKDVWGVHSPSREMIELVADIEAGWKIGWDNFDLKEVVLRKVREVDNLIRSHVASGTFSIGEGDRARALLRASVMSKLDDESNKVMGPGQETQMQELRAALFAEVENIGDFDAALKDLDGDLGKRLATLINRAKQGVDAGKLLEAQFEAGQGVPIDDTNLALAQQTMKAIRERYARQNVGQGGLTKAAKAAKQQQLATADAIEEAIAKFVAGNIAAAQNLTTQVLDNTLVKNVGGVMVRQPKPLNQTGGGAVAANLKEPEFSDFAITILKRQLQSAIGKQFANVDLGRNVAKDIENAIGKIADASRRGLVDQAGGTARLVQDILKQIENEIKAATERIATEPQNLNLLNEQIKQLGDTRDIIQREFAAFVSAPDVKASTLNEAEQQLASLKRVAALRDQLRRAAQLDSTRARITDDVAPGLALLRTKLIELQREAELLDQALGFADSPKAIVAIRVRAAELETELKKITKEHKNAETLLERLIIKEERLSRLRDDKDDARSREDADRILKEQVDQAKAQAIAEDRVNDLLEKQLDIRTRTTNLLKRAGVGVLGGAVLGAGFGPVGAAAGAVIGGAGNIALGLDSTRKMKAAVDDATRSMLQNRAAAVSLRTTVETLRKEQAGLEAEIAKTGRATAGQVAAWKAYQNAIKDAESRILKIDRAESDYHRRAAGGLLRNIPLLKRFTAGITEAEREQNKLNRTTARSQNFSGIRSGVIGGIIGSATLHATNLIQRSFTNLGDALVGFNARVETAQVGLRLFVQDAAQSQELIDKVVSFASSTPFNLEDILNGTKRLLAMGVAAEEVIPTFRDLGGAVSAVGGDKDTLDRVILAYGQIRAKNVLMSQDLRQLAEAGIPAFAILQEKLQLTADQTFDIGRQHISSARGVAALREGLRDLYGGSLLAQMDTFNGRAANFRDILSIVLGRIGAPFTNQLKLALQDISNVLQEPGTLRAAEQIGALIGDIAEGLREAGLQGREGLLTLFRILPTEIADVGIQLKQLQVFFSTAKFDFNPFDENNSFIVDIGVGQGVAERMGKFMDQVEEEAKEKAEQSARAGGIAIEVTANVEAWKIANAKETTRGFEKAIKESLDPSTLFSDLIPDEAEEQVVANLFGKLGPEAAQSLTSFLEAVEKNLEGGEATGFMAHIGSQLRETFLLELEKLGDAPSQEQITEATKRLSESLKIPGFADDEVLKLAQAYLELGVQQRQSYKDGALLAVQQAENTKLNRDETRAIEDKRTEIKTLTDAREIEHKAAQTAIDDIQATIDANARATRLMDRSFDLAIRNQEKAVKDFHATFDPVLEGYKTAHDEAASALSDLQQRHERTNRVIQTDIDRRESGIAAIKDRQAKDLEAYESLIQQQQRISRDLGFQKQATEISYKDAIDKATNAEKAHARVIKDSTLDQREKVRAQQEEIDRIDDKYRAELRAKGVTLSGTSEGIRAAEREHNKVLLDYAQRILDARKRGDEDAVKRLTEEREQSNINFENGLEAQRAKQQVEQDALDEVRTRAEEEQRVAKERLEDIQREGGRRQDQLAREGEALSDLKTAAVDEKDAAVAAIDEKIRIAEAFATVLGRSKEDLEAFNKSELATPEGVLADLQARYKLLQQQQALRVQDAEDIEKATAATLETQTKYFEEFFKQEDAKTAKLREDKEAYDLGQADILFDLETQKGKFEEVDKARQASFEKSVAPLNAELTKLEEIHTANERQRQNEIETTTNHKTQVDLRITAIEREVTSLQSIEDAQKRIREGYKKMAEEAQQSALLRREEAGSSTGQLVRRLLGIPDTQNLQGQVGQHLGSNPLLDELAKAQAAILADAPNALELMNALALKVAKLATDQGIELTAPEIVQELFPKDGFRMQIGVDPDVAHLIGLLGELAASTRGSVEQTQLLAQIGTLLNGDEMVRKLREAIAGTDVLEGSSTAKAAIEGGIATLDRIVPGLGARLLSAIGGGAADGSFDVQDLRDLIASEEGAGTEMNKAALAHLEAANELKNAAFFLQGEDPDTEKDTFASAVSRLITVLGRNPVFAKGATEFALSGELDTPSGEQLRKFHRNEAETTLREKLGDSEFAQDFVDEVLGHAEDWANILQRIDVAGDAQALDNVQEGFKALLSTAGGRELLRAELERAPATWNALIGQLKLMGDPALSTQIQLVLKSVNKTGEQTATTLVTSVKKELGVGSGLNKMGEIAMNLVGPDGIEYMSDGEGGLVLVNGAAVKVGTALYDQLVATLGVGTDNKYKNVAAALVGSDGIGWMASEDGAGQVEITVVKTASAMEAAFKKALNIGDGTNLFGALAESLLGVNGLGKMASSQLLDTLGANTAKGIVTAVNSNLQAEWVDVTSMLSGLFFSSVEEASATLLTQDALNGIAAVVEGAAGFISGKRSNRAPSSGPFSAPLTGPHTVTTHFNEVYNPRGTGASVHAGLDIAAPRGEKVMAIAAGTVIHASTPTKEMREDDPKGGLGYFVRIQHNISGRKFTSTYGHLSKVLVRNGQTVQAGDPIGLVGSTGNSTGPHLHLETRDDANRPIDPNQFLPRQGGGGLPGIPGSAPGSVPGGAPGGSKQQIAFSLIQGLVDTVRAAGGNFDVVLEEFFDGATSLTEEKLKGYSAFAQAEMKVAFDTLQTALQLLGGGDPEQLRAALEAAGVTTSTSSIWDLFMKEMFPDGLPNAFVNGIAAGFDERAIQAAWDEFWKRHPDLREKSLRDELRGGHPEFAALENINKVVEDRSLVPRLAELINANTQKEEIADFLRSLSSLDDSATLREAIALLRLTPGDPVLEQILRIVQTLGLSLDAINVGDFRSVLGGDPQRIAQAQALAGLKGQSSEGFVKQLMDALKVAGLFPDESTLADILGKLEIPTTAEGKKLRQFLIDVFGTKTLAEVRKLFLTDSGELQTPLINEVETQAGVNNITPEDREAARRIREFALKNKTIHQDGGLPDITDTAVTAILEMIRDLPEGGTIQDILAKFADVIVDDSPLGQFVKLLRDIATTNPNASLSDIKGLLFGGEGFEPVDQIDATRDNIDALDANTAALLGATLDNIDVWTALLREHRETAPKLEDKAASTLPVVPPAGVGVPGGAGTSGSQGSLPSAPEAPDTRTEEQKKIDEARRRVLEAEQQVLALESALEIAIAQGNKAQAEKIRKLLNEAELERSQAEQALAGLEKPSPTEEELAAQGDEATRRRRLEFTVDKYSKLYKAAVERGDTAAANAARRRVKDAETELEALDKAQDAREAAGENLGKPMDELVDPAEKLAGAIRNEINLREELNKILEQGLTGIQKPVAPPPPPVTTGGGGPQAESTGDTFVFDTTVNEANDATFTAKTVVQTQIWQRRAMGDRGGRI